MCQNDIALVVLNQAINDLPIMPIRLLRPTRIGESMSVVGYGDTGLVRASIDDFDASIPLARLRRDGVRVLDTDTAGGTAVR